jgi:hypothetical protein
MQNKRARNVTQVVECLSSMLKALGSIPTTINKKKKNGVGWGIQCKDLSKVSELKDSKEGTAAGTSDGGRVVL